jgi:hypothetical protein
MTEKKIEKEARLKKLASDIQAEHRHCIDGVKGLLGRARSIGQWLDEARKDVKQGYWKAWIRDNCTFTDTMALKYQNVAHHYDALISHFKTPEEEERSLSEFFALAAEMEAKAKKARSGKTGTEPTPSETEKKAPADPFHLEAPELWKKQKEVKQRKQNGPLPVEKNEEVVKFLKTQRERLLGAIKRFVCTKEVKEAAGDLDAAHLGILLLESLKALLDTEELFLPPNNADATAASKPPEPTNRVDPHIDGNGQEKKAA